MKTTLKTTDLTPGKIVYRVDVYEKNQIGICKGYFDNYINALFECDHDIIVSELQDMQAHTQVTMIFINANGDEVNVENYYFI